MLFLAFLTDDQQCALGARLGDEVVNLTAAGLPTTLDALLQEGDVGMARAKAALVQAVHRVPLAGLRYLPPLQHPSKAFAIGLNYVDHAAEGQFEAPKVPIIFQRYPSSWVAHQEPIVRPAISEQLDYEAELVAVIGKAGRGISKGNALSHVMGYSLFNDGSVRDHQFRSSQWMMGKNFDKSGSFGPEVVTADELPLGAVGLQIQCRLNGQMMQSGNTRDMIFDVATLVAACSEATELQPGDIIITGTPAGVGFARRPPVWLRPGDTCEVEVEGIGILCNPVVAER